MVVAVQQDARIDAAAGASAVAVALAVALTAFVVERRGRRADELEARAARLEQEREERDRAAAAAERLRIARELHDVVAHSVSVMTVQAGAARVVLDAQPGRVRESLQAVEETGRQALAELRRLLGVLRLEEGEPALAPQPGLADLDALLAQARGAGLPVQRTIEGEPAALPPGVDLAAYRIVQEALTNARRHAAAAQARVAVRYGQGIVELEITNEGRRAIPGEGGHGLVGMRERAALYGGELEAGPRPDGGYAVRARLPIGAGT
jgi:signal transduction histidine kinase